MASSGDRSADPGRWRQDFEPASPGDAAAGNEPARSQRATSDPCDASLLERVLQQTISAAAEGNRSESSDLEALVKVARRHQGHALTLEPVMVELVQCLLELRFGKSATPPPAWHSLAREIAGTLLDDPASHERLQVFWARLSEAVQ